MHLVSFLKIYIIDAIKMEAIVIMMDKIALHNLDVGSEHWVDVTHINSPLSFYVRFTVCRRYMPILHSYQHRLLPKKRIHIGAIVIYKSMFLQCNVRGRVMFIHDVPDKEITCELFAIDYGCYEKDVPLKILRESNHSADLPGLAMHCQLADCKPRFATFCDNAIQDMKFFVGKEQTTMIVRGKTPDTPIVQLFNSCPHDIATMLAYNGYTTLGYGDNMSSVLGTVEEPETRTYNTLSFEVGDTMIVKTQSVKSMRNFYVARDDNYEDYLNARDRLSLYCRRQREMLPQMIKEGMALGVLVININKYERALVVDITVPGQKACVRLVDWGLCIEVPFSLLKPMAEEFFVQPAAAIHCCVKKRQTKDITLKNNLLPGNKFQMTVLRLCKHERAPHIVQISPLPKT